MSIIDTVKRAASKCPCARKAKALIEKRRLAKEEEAKKSK